MRINELTDMRTPSIKQITETLLRDSQPYLNVIDGNIQKYVMWRGISGAKERDFGAKQTRLSDRENLNTPKHAHDAMNQWFNEHYGRPWRNGVFVTGKEEQARSYTPLTTVGRSFMDAHAIFPIGDFEYLWNPKVDDMFNKLIQVDFQGIPQLMNELQPFKTDGLKEALSKDVEIIVWVDKYYYLEARLLPEIGKFLL